MELDVSQLLYQVFGEHPDLPTLGKSKEDQEHERLTLEQYVRNIRSWISGKLIALTLEDETNQEGFVGYDDVVLMAENQPAFTNYINLSKDHLTVEALSVFPTCIANCCVFRGKWMYEVFLRTNGVIQVGWCSASCIFGDSEGVGDTKTSYGYDGSKKRIWNFSSNMYGPSWRTGDIIACCLDMDGQKIEYFRNGVPLGDAFTNVRKGEGFALFPGVSLSLDECLTVNFGGSPFRFPITDYHALQAKPLSQLKRADFLLKNLTNLSRLITKFNLNADKSNFMKNKLSGIKMPGVSAFCSILGEILIDPLVPLLHNSYVLKETLYGYIQGMCVLESDHDNSVQPGMPNSILFTFLSLLWTGMDDQMGSVITALIEFLLSLYLESPVGLEYEKQRNVLGVLLSLCNHSMTRRHIIEKCIFKKNAIVSFLHITPPDEATLSKLLPNDKVLTRGSQRNLLEASKKLSKCISRVYALQINLLKCLIDNEDPGSGLASCRKIFLPKLRNFVFESSQDDHLMLLFRHRRSSTQVSPVAALSFVCILLETVKTSLEENKSIKMKFVDPTYFYDGSFLYFLYDRVGGIFSALRKSYRAELLAALGEESIQNYSTREELNGLSIFARDFSRFSAFYVNSSNSSGNSNSPIELENAIFRIPGHANRQVIVEPGCADEYGSLCELLDCCIMMYNGVAHKHIKTISDFRDNNEKFVMQLKWDATQESFCNLKNTKQSDNVIKQELTQRFNNRRIAFKEKLTDMARKQSWFRGVTLSEYRRDLLTWMLNSVFKTLSLSSTQGNLFSFVPEMYMSILPLLSDTIFDYSHHDIMVKYNLDFCRETMQLAAEFVGSHAGDPRIIVPSAKDATFLLLGSLLRHQDGVRVLEKASPSSQMSLVRVLLRVSDPNAWAQINWMLVRFWTGHGFANRETRPSSIWFSNDSPDLLGLTRTYESVNYNFSELLYSVAPAVPSQQYQSLIGRYLIGNEPLCTSVLNSILTKLNWAFSEFLYLIQEFQTDMTKSGLAELELRQMRACDFLFRLTVLLLRTIEMIVNIAPGILKDPQRDNTDVLLRRVCQVVSQILSRVTVPFGCFQFVIDLSLPLISSVNHFSIISASCGVLLGLLEEEMEMEEDKNKRASNMLLNDPSFDIAHIEFMLGDIKRPKAISTENLAAGYSALFEFKLSDYATHVSDIEMHKVQKMIKYLHVRRALMTEAIMPSDDSLCYICCTKPISVTFLPCQHQSCGACIDQHLMNNHSCFYCKRYITKIISMGDGKVLFERKSFPVIDNDMEAEIAY